MKQVVSLLTVCLLMFGALTVQAADKPWSKNAKAPVAAVERVNINSADAETIANNLQRIGAKKAAAIVEYRKAHGKFTSKEQLLEVKGIGEATLKLNESKIVL